MPIKSFLISFLFLGGLFSLQAQEIGLTHQQYPTGTIPGATFTLPVGNQNALQLRVGYNIVYHGDAGVHENEEGGGLGFSPAWLHSFKEDRSGLYIGGRLDIWFNGIDWADNIGAANEVNGMTDIVVVQPTAILGYRLNLGDKFVLTPELAVGAEINAIQDGEDVGQGAILLMGITLARRF
jgi:hypothetical protein